MRDSPTTWQSILAQGFNRASDLLRYLNLPTELAAEKAELIFRTRVPQGFASRMRKGDAQDPLLLQVLATAEELNRVDDYIKDPLKESESNPIPGLLHKYHGRVLLTLTGACAINCRYCFRRHFPYQDNNPGREGWQRAVDYIAADPSIREVILSGGDPLLAPDSVISALLAKLKEIPHVKTLRIHSRIPVVLPERIDDEFLRLFEALNLNKVLVLHVNHPQELDEGHALVMKRLAEAGFTLLNQTVLLAGINNRAEILVQLSERLFAYGILPYYLHLLDKVEGAAHFDLPIAEVETIYLSMQSQLPGYLLPRLVCESPGLPAKQLLFRNLPAR